MITGCVISDSIYSKVINTIVQNFLESPYLNRLNINVYPLGGVTVAVEHYDMFSGNTVYTNFLITPLKEKEVVCVGTVISTYVMWGKRKPKGITVIDRDTEYVSLHNREEDLKQVDSFIKDKIAYINGICVGKKTQTVGLNKAVSISEDVIKDMCYSLGSFYNSFYMDTYTKEVSLKTEDMIHEVNEEEVSEDNTNYYWTIKVDNVIQKSYGVRELLHLNIQTILSRDVLI